jgi:hypothetical protein
VESDKLVLLDDKGILDGYIHFWVSGAHCPHHQVFFTGRNGEKVFFGGDVAPSAAADEKSFYCQIRL